MGFYVSYKFSLLNINNCNYKITCAFIFAAKIAVCVITELIKFLSLKKKFIRPYFERSNKIQHIEFSSL